MNNSNISNAPKVLFLSHGGGPMPLLGDVGHKELVANLKTMSERIGKPSAMIVISAHWEANCPIITSAAQPTLVYDFRGFPPESYQIEYPAPGNPLLASKIHALLNKYGLGAELDGQRGFDHGLFVPLKIMYPKADIPCVQVSLVNTLDPRQHIRIGQALSELRHENLLIVGSGFTFHNMRAFFSPPDVEVQNMNESFEAWLIDTCSNRDIDEQERTHRFENWQQAPFARYCHPREEHLLPLHVCYGVSQRACSQVFELRVLGKKASAYIW
ncbi:class III extradiol ring-cleavage dioxygenase [Thiomicrorhabdus sp. zzn3]|uniref:DODA-type extradiol aromatic ring-opening family dioxygenase n=1 Tax=Thiomicrorhabdus sp. zzn3 TaxID=3039775 RepID=UPI0024371ED7|nr:class III extradiol ring-cleavage dioxygenase [Thiomicrorhabdus sp. zzn3]MDG6777737.1 class III extradiol ring-cleavage dioxygenase [Thiomicrorhabdus sp. zzn3]